MREEDTAVTVIDLVKTYGTDRGRVRAVNGVSFEVERGEFYTLLGPSGCGKTTTMRCIAGLERTDEGRIVVAGNVVSSHRPRAFVSPHKRDIGMVFQSYAIWPHMTVFDNVAFPLRYGRKRASGAELRRRVEDALSLVRLDDLVDRMATDLSGGQQQRLALARALVREPTLLLLDEPLSNLDAKLREHMRAELRELQRRLGITTIYVTHDQIEALSMSSRIALMSDGEIVQEGRPRELYQRPMTQFVASFLGNANVLPAEALERRGDHWVLATPAGRLSAACPPGVRAGSRLMVSIRPESVSIHRAPPPRDNVLSARVETVMFLGDSADCRLVVGDSLLRCREHANSDYRHGDDVFLEIPHGACTVISDEHGVAAPEYQEGLPPRAAGSVAN